jgi:hypothetical protein
MRRMLGLVAVAAFITEVAVGCSSGPADSAPAVTNPDEACAAFAPEYCKALASCGPVLFDWVYGDAAKCAERAKISCLATLGANNTSITPDKVDRCRVDLHFAVCTDMAVGGLPAACVPDTGKLADGAACGDDGQCKSTFCSKTNGNCGVCAPLSAPGSSCATAPCSRGLTCSGAKTCVKPLALGATCVDTKTTPCAAGLSCFRGKCVAGAAAGAACDTTETTAPACDVLPGVFCVAKSCVKVGASAAGGPCGLLAKPPAVCSAGGTCSNLLLSGVCASAAADGATCDALKGPNCIPPAQCVSGRCTLPDPNSCK